MRSIVKQPEKFADRMMLRLKSKNGQFASILLAFVLIFVVALTLFFLNHFTNEIYNKFSDVLGNTTNIDDDGAAQDAIIKIRNVENSAWDFGFFAIFIGLIMAELLAAFATRINVAFYWIFALLGIIIFITGVILSNIWQEVAANPVFAETITRFPLTNSILGTFFPTIVTAVIFIIMILFFGKPPGRQ